MKKTSQVLLVAAAAVALLGSGCAKKKVAAKTPPAPQAASQTASTPASAPAVRQTPRAQQQSAAAPAQSRYPDAATRARIDQLLARIEDAYFDYNQHTLRPDAVKALQSDSSELRDIIVQYPDYKLKIEGHCDERGSEEYNLALGEARATAAKDYLVGVGIPDKQLATVSYGKNKPVCDEHDEACWQKNRRIHIVAEATR
ncbi:MAG TPA: OmpA family protein [Candidatus Limnocylindrales bacterium]|nr:OmpA family protein [Candidatus Limnocylindrales bacterium]